ncbi:FAD-dependent monooxygenase [Natrinema salinisoli]|uniref:FAD-dependent monooxygenase n=1 Tax=Natrinema salinisoli TaxID=2878535 RepID=UPI001CF0788F|nr:FAD-dependent monooxygenase [Natrinema salinisoli]
MNVATIGGGPGGLYASLLLKRSHPSWDVTVYERNPRGVTYGWGIVFPNRTLSNLADADPASHEAITETFDRWDPFDIITDDDHFRCDGNTFASMMRTDLLSVLEERCREVGVELEYESEITDPTAIATEADLCIAADGIHSHTREVFADEFSTEINRGSVRFSWFGTDAEFEALTHIFVENEDGIWCAHTYPGPTSTFIVDCDAETWKRSGIAEMTEDEYLAYLEDVFADQLDGHDIKSQQDRWQRFQTVTNENWYHDNVVLVGDAAHTAHYSIGSGTTLAMEDAIGLMEAFESHDEIDAALSAYESARKPFVETLLSAAERSRIHFEDIDRYYDLPPRQFAIHHLTRSGRLTYGSLQRRDPTFTDAFDEWFVKRTPGGTETRPPARQPVRLADTVVSNRYVRALEPTSSAEGGMPSAAQLSAFTAAADERPGLLLTEPLAVAPEGRPVIGTPGLYTEDHGATWTEAVETVPDGVTAGVHLTHAGASGGREPRVFDQGDRTERESTWAPRLSDDYPVHPQSFDPTEMSSAERNAVIDDFVSAARRAADADFGYVQLQAASSSVLSQFLTAPDIPFEDGIQFVQTVVSDVADAVPPGTPLGVTVPVSDSDECGLSLEEAFVAVRKFSAAGCDVVAPVDTTTSERGLAEKGPSDFSDDIRNEVDISTLATVPTASADKVNTLVATGRADLCVVQGTPSRND